MNDLPPRLQQILSDQKASIQYQSLNNPKIMTIEIKPSEASDDHYFVNGKLVWQNMSGTWISKKDMEPIEKQFFEEYLKTVRKIKRGITAIYSI